MKFRTASAVLLGVAAISAVALAGCSSQKDFESGTKVVFELEGGSYQNCTRPVTYYYDIDDDKEIFIAEPTALSGREITRSGYTLVGWYRTRIVDGDTVTYGDEWDFTQDKVTAEGVTLYAAWRADVVYSYNVCYYDEDGLVKVLGSYEVNAGDKFDDLINYAGKRIGYTALGYLDENGGPWDENFVHPGGEASLEINVFVNYIKGRYSLVSTASQLKAAKNQNIYLLNDIDMGGAALSFGDYSSVFLGNGHTVGNFTVNYSSLINDLKADLEDESKKSLYISLFGAADGAEIRDVRFENVKVEIDTTNSRIYKIYVAPVSVVMTDTAVSNVSFSGELTVVRLPSSESFGGVVMTLDAAYYAAYGECLEENVEVNLVYNGGETA